MQLTSNNYSDEDTWMYAMDRGGNVPSTYVLPRRD